MELWFTMENYGTMENNYGTIVNYVLLGLDYSLLFVLSTLFKPYINLLCVFHSIV